jgi:hypothetical protein
MIETTSAGHRFARPYRRQIRVGLPTPVARRELPRCRSPRPSTFVCGLPVKAHAESQREPLVVIHVFPRRAERRQPLGTCLVGFPFPSFSFLLDARGEHAACETGLFEWQRAVVCAMEMQLAKRANLMIGLALSRLLKVYRVVADEGIGAMAGRRTRIAGRSASRFSDRNGKNTLVVSISCCMSCTQRVR